jgi:hypothetical protein
VPCYRVVVRGEGRAVTPIITAASQDEAGSRALALAGLMGLKSPVVEHVIQKCGNQHEPDGHWQAVAAAEDLERIEHDFWDRLR